MARYALYPGCLILNRFFEYERAAYQVITKLGHEVFPLPEMACCGSSLLPSFSDSQFSLAVYLLAQAEAVEADIITLCGSCTNTLKTALFALNDSDFMRQTNGVLQNFGLRIKKEVRVKHILQVLDEHLGELRSLVEQPLPYYLAVTYPCQVFRPGRIMEFDHPFYPRSMHRILEAVGAEIYPYPGEYECCGATLYMTDPDLALQAGAVKLKQAYGADALVDACGNCQLLLERLQGSIRRRDPEVKGLPVVFLPQMVVEALGGERALDLQTTRTKPVSVPLESGREDAESRTEKEVFSCRDCGRCGPVCLVERLGRQAMPSLYQGHNINPWLCSTCWKCQEVCPRGLDLQQTMYRKRRGSVAPEAFVEAINGIKESGFVYPPEADLNDVRDSYDLPPVSFIDRSILHELIKL